MKSFLACIPVIAAFVAIAFLPMEPSTPNAMIIAAWMVGSGAACIASFVLLDRWAWA